MQSGSHLSSGSHLWWLGMQSGSQVPSGSHPWWLGMQSGSQVPSGSHPWDRVESREASSMVAPVLDMSLLRVDVDGGLVVRPY
jgi:hypothetical protein